MGKLVSTSLLVAFILISALANFGDSHAAARDTVKSSVEQVVPTGALKASEAVESVTGDDRHAAHDSDDCPCKQDHSSSKYVCGVTLALSDGAAALHTPSPSKAGFAFNKASSIPDFVDLLKRPPRNFL